MKLVRRQGEIRGQRQGATESLMKAFTPKGYDLNNAWGMNLDGQKFGGQIMPEMMRWLWRDGPGSTGPNDKAERDFRQPAPTVSLSK